MNWQQKLKALQSIAECSLLMRDVGNWYVSQSVEIKKDADDTLLRGEYGNGETPEAAVNDHWRVLVDELPVGGVIVTNAYDKDRRKHLRWNDFMWEEVKWSGKPNR